MSTTPSRRITPQPERKIWLLREIDEAFDFIEGDRNFIERYAERTRAVYVAMSWESARCPLLNRDLATLVSGGLLIKRDSPAQGLQPTFRLTDAGREFLQGLESDSLDRAHARLRQACA